MKYQRTTGYQTTVHTTGPEYNPDKTKEKLGAHSNNTCQMKTIIHINQHKIRSNHKSGKREPVITCKNYKSNEYAHEAIILDKEGVIVAKVVYSPDKPLSCGARVWVETQHEVILNKQQHTPA